MQLCRSFGYYAAILGILLALSNCARMPEPAPREKPVMAPPRSAVDTRPPVYSGAPYPLPLAPGQTQSAPEKTVKVALLLPLSGESAQLGSAMMDAATLALFDKYDAAGAAETATRVVLLPKDTGSTPAEAKAVAEEAIDEGARLIVGPLYSSAVAQVAPVAQARGIGVLTFSNNKAVAGQGTYLMGFMPDEQVRRVADFIFDHNFTRVAILAPADAYGSIVTREFAKSAKEKGATIAAMEVYPPEAKDMEARVAQMAAKLNDKELGIQALMITEGGDQLRSIVSMLQKNKVDFTKVRLLGTGKWDDPSTLGSGAAGGWFATSPPERNQNFEQRFAARYGYRPPRLASLAYDAVALSATLAMVSGEPDFSAKSLTDDVGFSGPANGIFRFKPSGMIERGLSVVEVTPRGFRTIDPAPGVFRY